MELSLGGGSGWLDTATVHRSGAHAPDRHDSSSKGWGLLLGHQRGPHLATNGDFLMAMDRGRTHHDAPDGRGVGRACLSGPRPQRHHHPTRRTERARRVAHVPKPGVTPASDDSSTRWGVECRTRTGPPSARPERTQGAPPLLITFCHLVMNLAVVGHRCQIAFELVVLEQTYLGGPVCGAKGTRTPEPLLAKSGDGQRSGSRKRR